MFLNFLLVDFIASHNITELKVTSYNANFCYGALYK